MSNFWVWILDIMQKFDFKWWIGIFIFILLCMHKTKRLRDFEFWIIYKNEKWMQDRIVKSLIPWLLIEIQFKLFCKIGDPQKNYFKGVGSIVHAQEI